MIFWYSHSDIFHLSVISALQHLSTHGHTGWPLILILIRTRKTWAVKLGGSENSATLQICDSQQSQTLTFVAVSPHKQAHQHCHQLMRKLFVKGRCYWMKFFTLNACSIKEWEVHHAHITHTHTQGKQKKHMVVNWVLCHLKQSDEICKHSTGPPGVVTWCLLHTTWLVDAYVGIWGRTPDWCFFATLYSHSVWKYSWQKQQFQRKNLMCKLHQSKKHRCDIQAEFSEPFHRRLSHCLTWKFHNDPVKSEIFQ